MGKINELEISKQDKIEFKNLALHNKKDVMFKKVRIKFENNEYDFIIKGVGQKAVKLELYCYYESILKNKDDGIIEKRLYDKINTIYDNRKPFKTCSEV